MPTIVQKPEFVIISGISGSGKSTMARKLQETHDYSIVSRDDIRMSVFGEAFGGRVDEKVVTQIEYASIRALLQAGHSVVSDNTNLYPSTVLERFNIAIDSGADIALLQVECTLAEALENNRQRGIAGGRFVPEHIITKQEHAFVDNREAITNIYTALRGGDLV